MAQKDFSQVVAGTLPAGTKLEGFGTILRSSLTAYEVEWDDNGRRGQAWVPFLHVHGRPAAVEPLVVLG